MNVWECLDFAELHALVALFTISAALLLHDFEHIFWFTLGFGISNALASICWYWKTTTRGGEKYESVQIYVDRSQD